MAEKESHYVATQGTNESRLIDAISFWSAAMLLEPSIRASCSLP